jgi:F-type H+-transporting ATPase subunit b
MNRKSFILILISTVCLFGLFVLPVTASSEITEQGTEHMDSMFSFSWTVLISQAINFFVLLYILKRFLFVPIGKILEKRREEIGRTRIITEKEHKTAMELKDIYEKHIANIEQEAYEIKQRVIHEANLKTAEIILEARQKAEQIVEEGEMELFNERQAAWIQLREEVAHITLSAAERVVEESLNDEIHRRLIDRTIKKLESDLPYHIEQ